MICSHMSLILRGGDQMERDLIPIWEKAVLNLE